MKRYACLILGMLALVPALPPVLAEEGAAEEAPAADAPAPAGTLTRAEVQQMIDEALAGSAGSVSSGKGGHLSLGGGAELIFQSIPREKSLDASRPVEDMDPSTAAVEQAYGGPVAQGYEQNRRGHGALNKAWVTLTAEHERGFFLKLTTEFRGNNTLNVDEAYAGVNDVADQDLDLHAGLKIPWMRPPRKTRVYPLVSNAFDRQEYFGLFATGRQGFGDTLALDWHADLTTGDELRTRAPFGDAIGLNDSFPMIARDRRNTNTQNATAALYGLGAGPTLKFGDHSLSLMGWAYHGRVSAQDLAFLQANYFNYTDPAGTSPDPSTHKARRGGYLDAQFVFGDVTAGLRLQTNWATDGKLHQSGYFFQPELKYTVGAEYLDTVLFLFRFGRLGNSLNHPVDPATNQRRASKYVDRPETWDRDATTIALQFEFVKNWTFSLEHTWNREEVGDLDSAGVRHLKSGDPSSNELIAMIKVVF